MIAIVDYGLGNVRSIQNAIKKINSESVLTGDPDQILNSDALILPGVGSYRAGVQALIERNLKESLIKYVQRNKPILGICLGMQLLLEIGYEFGSNDGLGLIEGEVNKLANTNEKIPHIGWNKIYPRRDDRIFDKITNHEFYFVHSFVAKPSNEKDNLASCKYGEYEFCAAVKKNNIYGVQFHPEKSGENGLQLLKNFSQIGK